MRPVLCAGNQAFDIGHHLAAVTHTQREAVITLEESTELITGALVKQNGFGPAFAGTQHITVGETTAGHQTIKVRQ